MVALVWPAANVTVPDGNTPPVKSVLLAGFAPLPSTAQATEATPVVLPARVTVKVNAVLPLLPSLKVAFVAAIESVEGRAVSSFLIAPAAM